MVEFNFSGSVRAIEVFDYDSYSILTKQGELYTESWKTKISTSFRFPIIRRMDNEHILIAEMRSKENDKNAQIYNKKGDLIDSFVIGDAVQDILVFDRKIIVSYFDEGVMAQKKFSKEGLIIFNKKGKMIWGFNSNTPFEIWDCYHIIKTGIDKVLFFGYGKFPICELDINFQTIEEIEIPFERFGSIESISCFDNKIFWKTAKEVLCFDRSDNSLRQLKEFDKKDKRKLLKNSLLLIKKEGFEIERIDF